MSTRVLLVYPNVWAEVFPLSILLLSAVLKDHGHDVSLFAATRGESETLGEDFSARIEQFDPQLIAFSVVEDAYPLAEQLLDAIPETSALVLLGGVFPSFAPHLALTHPRVDAVCVGEGERPLTELADRLSTTQSWWDIGGLQTTEGGNPPYPLVDLNSLPAPDYALLIDTGFKGPIPIIPHRGCPYRCTFCNSPAQAAQAKARHQGSFFRRETMSHLQRSLNAILRTPGIDIPPSGLYFCSDTLLAWNKREFDAFVEMYADYRIPFIGHTTPESVQEYRLRKLADLGMSLVNIGVQHGNENFRRKVLKRAMSNRDLHRAMKTAVESGIFVSSDAIVGFPLETPELALDTLRFMEQLPTQAKNCSVFVPYHGTELRQLAESRGFIAPGTLARWQPSHSQLNMPQFPVDEIRHIQERHKRHSLGAPIG